MQNEKINISLYCYCYYYFQCYCSKYFSGYSWIRFFWNHEDCQKYSDKYNYIKEKEISEILPGNILISTIDNSNIPKQISEDEKKPFLNLLKEGENKCKKIRL